MKNHLRKLLFIVACIGFMFSGCEKETYEKSVVVELPFSSRLVRLDQIPEIKSYLNQNEFSYLYRTSNSSDSEIIYDYKNIVEITDKEGYINYIISFIIDNSPKNEFYNLIINILPNGEKKMFTGKYTCNLQSYDKFVSHNYDFNYFDGFVEYGVVKTNVNRYGDGPCPDVTLPFGTNIPEGAGNYSLNNGTSISSTQNSNIYNITLGYSTSYTYYTINWNGTVSATTQITTTPQLEEEHYYNLYFKIRNNNTSNINNPCPQQLPEGYMTPNISQVQMNYLKEQLSLSPLQWRWFTQPGNENKFQTFYNAYLSDESKNTPETKVFFREALNKMIANPILTISYILYNKTKMSNDSIDLDNNTVGNYDNSIYENFNAQQSS